jgi:hypothetical protein
LHSIPRLIRSQKGGGWGKALKLSAELLKNLTPITTFLQIVDFQSNMNLAEAIKVLRGSG